VDFGALLRKSSHGVVVHVAQANQHDPCVHCPDLGLGVHPSGLGVNHFGLSVYLFGLDVYPLDLNGLFGEVDADGSRALFFHAPLLVPFGQGGLRVSHDLLQGLAQRKGKCFPGKIGLASLMALGQGGRAFCP
jgi:hypothetical protein